LIDESLTVSLVLSNENSANQANGRMELKYTPLPPVRFDLKQERYRYFNLEKDCREKSVGEVAEIVPNGT
jgi:hypothetical protein